jgi:uncharacterized repeat protein (TIGR03803 family)
MYFKRYGSSVALTIFTFVAVGWTTFASSSAQAQTYKVIYSFTGGADGASPEAGLTMDRAGNLYGTTFAGGAGFGTVFELRHLRSGWIFSPLHLFAGGPNDGGGPVARVVFGPEGNLYGTTSGGGQRCPGLPYNGCGTVFRLSPPVSTCTATRCIWPESVLYRFTGQSDGADPASGDLVFDRTGNLYGATLAGGGAGRGVVYQLVSSHGSWTEKVLHNADQNSGFPPNGVILDNSGNLYGTGQEGGDGNGIGTVFELTPSGSVWNLTLLHVFGDPVNGTSPFGGVIFDSTGNLYGTTVSDGSNGGGTVFDLSPSNGRWTFTLIDSLAGTGGSEASLFMDGAGSVFKLARSGRGWTYTSLHDFSGGSDGGLPQSSLILDGDGNVYGTASSGGANSAGVVFEITP